MEGEVFYSKPAPVFSVHQEHTSDLFSAFNKLYKTKSFSDFTIQCQSKSFKAHRAVLVAQSTYFDSLLLDDEGNERCPPASHVTLDTIDPDTFEMILDFIYSGCLINIPEVIAKSLGEAADKLGIQDVVTKCRQVELSNTTPTPGNCLDGWKTAIEVDDDDLCEKFSQIALTHFSEVTNHPSFVDLDLTTTKVYLGHRDLRVDSPDLILLAALNWVRADQTKRLTQLPQLLHAIPLQQIEVKVLKYVLKAEPILKQHSKARTILEEVINPSEASPSAPAAVTTPVKATPVKATPVKATPVKATPVKATPVKATPVEATPVKATPVKATPVEATPVKATPVKGTRVKSPQVCSPPQASPHSCVAVAWSKSQTIKLYDESLREEIRSIAAPPQITNIENTGCCFMGDDLFVCGKEKLYSYSLSSGEWQERGDLNAQRVCPALISVGDKVFILGGRRGAESISAVSDVEVCYPANKLIVKAGQLSGTWCNVTCCCLLNSTDIAVWGLKDTGCMLLQVYSTISCTVTNSVKVMDTYTGCGVVCANDYIIMCGYRDIYLCRLKDLANNKSRSVEKLKHFSGWLQAMVLSEDGQRITALGEGQFVQTATVSDVISDAKTGWSYVRVNWTRNKDKKCVSSSVCTYYRLGLK